MPKPSLRPTLRISWAPGPGRATLKRDDDLTQFVRRALMAGKSKHEIAQVLGEAGWRPAQVESAVDSYADLAFPVPVPRPEVSPSAREAFLYLLLFTSAYMSVTGLGTILYQLINLTFPDLEVYGDWTSGTTETLRWGIAILIVFLPTYLLLDRHIERLKRTDPTHGRSSVRRSLTYLTLYIAATVLLFDSGYLVYKFLNGELVTRILLKCVVVAGLAGLFLWRYLNEMRTDELLKDNRS